MTKVLISAAYLQKDIADFEQELRQKGVDFDLYPVEERLEEPQLLEIIDRYDGVICGDDQLTSKVIDKAYKLKVIVKWGTGVDSIDKQYAEKNGVRVFNTPNAFSEPVSDSVMAMILSFARRLFVSDRIMKNGGWEKAFGFSLMESTIGVIGMGNIGSAVIRKAHPFGAILLVNDIRELDQGYLQKFSAKQVKLQQLLQESDFVSLNCDLNPTSHHLINANTLDSMKQSAFLINTARGPIVEENALVKALEEQKIAGAGLDVFEEEPLPEESPLRTMEQCILSSHNVNASPYYWQKVHRNSLDLLYKGLGL